MDKRSIPKGTPKSKNTKIFSIFVLKLTLAYLVDYLVIAPYFIARFLRFEFLNASGPLESP